MTPPPTSCPVCGTPQHKFKRCQSLLRDTDPWCVFAQHVDYEHKDGYRLRHWHCLCGAEFPRGGLGLNQLAQHLRDTDDVAGHLTTIVTLDAIGQIGRGAG